MTLTERLLPDGGRQKPLESERDKDLPPSARLLISVILSMPRFEIIYRRQTPLILE